MKTLIIYTSIHHQNTFKIAQVLAKTLNARLMKVDEVKPEEIIKYDLVGFGSGIYMWKHHQSLLELVDKFPAVQNSVSYENLSVSEPTLKNQNTSNKVNGGIQTFIFSTSGAGGGITLHKTLKTKLINKGFKIIGGFNCKAWDTFGPLKLIGGINKGHPDKQDLEKAREFAKKLLRNSN